MQHPQTAMITGASGNVGAAVVKKLLDNGYKVIGIVHKKSETPVLANNYEEIALDLLNEAACQKVVAEIIQKFGSIDIAVLTAGGFEMGNIEATDISAIRKQVQLNFETAYNISRPVFLQMMKQNSGRIFLTGSKAGANTSDAKGVTAYGLSKSLLFNLAKIMNAESKGNNVVTCMVVPGIIDTPQNRQSMPAKDYSRWTTPAQIANVISFYSSAEASVIREPVIKVYNNV